MLSGNLSIDTLVCLSCGEIIPDDSLVVKRVVDLKVPDEIKSAGKLFSTFACPKCEGVFIGFLAIERPKSINVGIVLASTGQNIEASQSDDIIDIDPVEIDSTLASYGLTPENMEVTEKVKKVKTKPRAKISKHKQTICSECNKTYVYGQDHAIDCGGTKCSICLAGAIKAKRGR